MIHKSGHCLCGDVTWALTGTQIWSCLCHCSDCRRNTASPVTAFFGVHDADFSWTGTLPKTYASSPDVTRSFCGTCGTPMAFNAVQYAGETYLYAATLDDPADFRPDMHVYYGEKLDWLHISDTLPKYKTSYSAGEM